jgi:hypothetical protein
VSTPNPHPGQHMPTALGIATQALRRLASDDPVAPYGQRDTAGEQAARKALATQALADVALARQQPSITT